IVFFFSSRRRHTRFSRDWSSDVCSSDLPNCLTVDGGAKLRLHPTAFGLVLWVRHVFPYGPVPVQEITCPVRGSNNSDTSHTSPPPPPQASVSRMLALDRALLLSP